MSRRVGGISQIEMRTATRHPILQRCFVRPANASERQAWQCVAYNISSTGIGVTLPTELAEGTVLAIEAWNLPGACPLQVRILQAQPIETVWLTGCEFMQRLSDADLHIWRSGPMDWMDRPQ